MALLYLIQHYDPNRWLRFNQIWSYNGRTLWGSTETVLVVPVGWGYRATLLLVIAAAVLAAYLLYRFIEEPCGRVMRRMLPRSMEV